MSWHMWHDELVAGKKQGKQRDDQSSERAALGGRHSNTLQFRRCSNIPTELLVEDSCRFS